MQTLLCTCPKSPPENKKTEKKPKKQVRPAQRNHKVKVRNTGEEKGGNTIIIITKYISVKLHTYLVIFLYSLWSVGQSFKVYCPVGPVHNGHLG